MLNRLTLFLALVFSVALSSRITAQGVVVWNGPLLTFSNAPGSLWFLAANQDQLTANVALTRDTKRGLFNALSEGGYSSANLSPADTEWAVGSLTNYSSLTYADWTTCYGGAHVLNPYILNNPSVLHLITDNIYLGITFTYWGGNGGGFAYERTSAVAVPEPKSSKLAGAGLLLLAASWRRLKCRRGAAISVNPAAEISPASLGAGVRF